MKPIKNIGNLPKHLGIFAKTIGGVDGAEFYECSNAKELEGLAKDKKCELTCTLDPNTDRGFLVGFDVKEDASLIIAGASIHTMVIYFTELKGSDFKRYQKMLDKHRTLQEDAMRKRQAKAAARRAEVGPNLESREILD